MICGKYMCSNCFSSEYKLWEKLQSDKTFSAHFGAAIEIFQNIGLVEWIKCFKHLQWISAWYNTIHLQIAVHYWGSDCNRTVIHLLLLMLLLSS